MNPLSPRRCLVLSAVLLSIASGVHAQTTCVPTLSSEAVTVRQGDTLGQLVVDRFFKGLEDPRVREELKLWGDQGMVARVASENQIRNANRIRPGDRIRLPDPSSCNQPAQPGQPDQPSQPDQPAQPDQPGTRPVTPPPVTAQPRQPSAGRLIAALVGAMAGPATAYFARGWLGSLAARSPLMAAVAVAIPAAITVGGFLAGRAIYDRMAGSPTPTPRAPDPAADVPAPATLAARASSTVDGGVDPIGGFDELRVATP